MERDRSAFRLSEVTYLYPRSQKGIEDVTLTVPRGCIYGLLGVNGAGKTTLMRLMLGLLQPAQGWIRCLGRDLATERRAVLASVGSLVEAPSVYQHLTGREHLAVFAVYTGSGTASIAPALRLVGLEQDADRTIGTYSLGMKQRLALATALLHDPEVLVLDEPMSGLDPLGVVRLRDLLSSLAFEHGKTVILSSHVLAEVEKTATHVGVIHEGRMRFQGTPAEMTTGERPLHLRVSAAARAADVLGLPSLELPAGPGTIEVAAQGDEQAAEALRRVISAGVHVFEATRQADSLERDFLALLREDSVAG